MEELLSPADQDGAEPTANSVTVTNLLRAACYSGHMAWVEKAGQILAAFSERLQKIPITLPEMARATAVFHHTLKQVQAGVCVSPAGPAAGNGPGGSVGAVTALYSLRPAPHTRPGQVIICGDPQGEDTKEMLRCIHSVFSPNKVEVSALLSPPSLLSLPALPILPCPHAQPPPPAAITLPAAAYIAGAFILLPSVAVASILHPASLLGSILSCFYL